MRTKTKKRTKAIPRRKSDAQAPLKVKQKPTNRPSPADVQRRKEIMAARALLAGKMPANKAVYTTVHQGSAYPMARALSAALGVTFGIETALEPGSAQQYLVIAQRDLTPEQWEAARFTVRGIAMFWNLLHQR